MDDALLSRRSFSFVLLGTSLIIPRIHQACHEDPPHLPFIWMQLLTTGFKDHKKSRERWGGEETKATTMVLLLCTQIPMECCEVVLIQFLSLSGAPSFLFLV
ncbi:hypothetical protein MUK42_36753 [Musa troglodytarum]|uniref:Uncharacterized protein n=1 Tax=Musa troglodytarum TaxID=320322 RepID=A0A9E7EB35_9LILI|nr:hypothetical protein MUK42_36753 [Musa troglodytarum]